MNEIESYREDMRLAFMTGFLAGMLCLITALVAVRVLL